MIWPTRGAPWAGDAPAAVFDGVTYAALGHLHRPQEISLGGSATRIRYSGSPLPFSFGEKHDTKSVVLVELGAEGVASLETVPTPVDSATETSRGWLWWTSPLRASQARIAPLVTQASAPPAMARSARPARSISNASPTACVAEEQAEASAKVGPFAP